MTGSISTSTRRTRRLRSPSEIGNGPLPRSEGSSHRQLGDGADHDRHRVDRDPVVLGHERRRDDQADDDHDVPEHRHERRGAELAVRLQHRRHEAGEAQQHDDREHDLRQLDGLVDQLVGRGPARTAA